MAAAPQPESVKVTPEKLSVDVASVATPMEPSPPIIQASTTLNLADPRSESPTEPAVHESLYTIALVHFISSLTALLVGLMLFSLALVCVLRRRGITLQALAQAHSVAPSCQLATTEAMTQPLPELRTLLAGEPGPKLELGPSYGEERRLKEEAERANEEAMLKHLFEQNLHLREQISELEAVEA